MRFDTRTHAHSEKVKEVLQPKATSSKKKQTQKTLSQRSTTVKPPQSDPVQSPAQQGGAGYVKEKHPKRIHSHQWHIIPIWKDNEKWKEHINKPIYIDGNTIWCNPEDMEVYGTLSFIDEDDLDKAFYKSLEYFTNLWGRIENQLKCEIIHDSYENIKLVRCKYGEMDSEIAKDCELKGDRIQIYAKEDGKLWFDIDWSWNFEEMHTLHPSTGKPDMKKVMKHIDDYRNNDPSTASQIERAVQQALQGMKEEIKEVIKEMSQENIRVLLGIQNPQIVKRIVEGELGIVIPEKPANHKLKQGDDHPYHG
ncbi:Uncharacterised protein [uncultured archaeon]|nr:Uncharacterised protein [uncultured archaeon]